MNIIWINRYSQTDEPDEQGRWARVGHLQHRSKDPMKILEIAWIKKIGERHMAYVDIGRGLFNNNLSSLEEAKKYCAEAIQEFHENYLNYDRTSL